MFIADGGAGGSAQSQLPAYSGAQRRLKLDAGSIPKARELFTKALADFDDQFQVVEPSVKAKPWGGDPVSKETAEKFNHDTFDAGDNAAMQALVAYRKQIQGVIDQLAQIEATYTGVETGNQASFNRTANA
ncbi:hypothetical protein KCV87_21635 [Actinosynnema pretiosum subsp. pretiosum]|uniref:PE domain-containing protein n=2 Tax=Actinosynnema TaxID=40566 RepID=C6WQX1_ACTMD|nr:hypothetical protein [Actinosynnema mirum]ACU40664.1 hypothetical protein Amir_6868 [Actinosynnema mirum DSM 43827]AXX34171.1 hypothetical protein APASM_6806 [Actinosynnema pretiosum subsp. pretiosum]QUF02106.1 hypothetical protein KCV87_21635 [Actinosynnema pretiosum subsp. pretiosum]